MVIVPLHVNARAISCSTFPARPVVRKLAKVLTYNDAGSAVQLAYFVPIVNISSRKHFPVHHVSTRPLSSHKVAQAKQRKTHSLKPRCIRHLPLSSAAAIVVDRVHPNMVSQRLAARKTFNSPTDFEGSIQAMGDLRCKRSMLAFPVTASLANNMNHNNLNIPDTLLRASPHFRALLVNKQCYKVVHRLCLMYCHKGRGKRRPRLHNHFKASGHPRLPQTRLLQQVSRSRKFDFHFLPHKTKQSSNNSSNLPSAMDKLWMA